MRKMIQIDMKIKIKLKAKHYFQIIDFIVLICFLFYFGLIIWQNAFRQKEIEQTEVEKRRFNIDQKLYEENKNFLESLRNYQIQTDLENLNNPFLPE